MPLLLTEMTSSHPADDAHSSTNSTDPLCPIAGVQFKKRVRPTASKSKKKRARTSRVHDDDINTERHFPPSKSLSKQLDQRQSDASHTPNRIQEQYKITPNDPSTIRNARNEATAPLLDVGGEHTTAPTSSKVRKPFGPMRAPAHLRTSVRVDYQPDVCKDYKETGYCGFGDACKFLHDRSDYKAGWQLDKDWATQQRERREKMLRGEDPDANNEISHQSSQVDDDGLPFACFICRGDFKQPVMTLCDHYFCEDCALQRIQNEGTCAICNKQMRGTLNAAPKLLAKLKLKRFQE